VRRRRKNEGERHGCFAGNSISSSDAKTGNRDNGTTKSRKPQSNKRRQDGNGRVSVGRGAVANLRESKKEPSARNAPSPAEKQQPHQKQTSKSITCPQPLDPQHDNPPLLDTAQE
jgi:hypothetical protein